MQNHTYQTYFLVDLLPTVLVVFVAPLLFILVVAILCLLIVLSCKKLSSLNCCKGDLRNLLYHVIKHVYKRILYKSQIHPKQFVIAGYRAPKWYNFWLFCLLYGTAAFAGAAFWDKFLLENSTTCNSFDPELACFSLPASRSDSPVDCSDTDYLTNNNLTEFICFKFTLDFVNATGAAGGIFFLSAVVVGSITVLLLKCSQGRNPKRKKWLRHSVTLVFQVLGFIITLAVPVILWSSPILGDLLYWSIGSILQTFAAIFLILVAITTPWYWFEKEGDKTSKTQQREQDPERGIEKDQL